jgi:metal-responsive CopG/Arc/MetJ family transcriptional regulator
MKTAVSIPDEVFEEAEALAGELKTSRSELYSRALREFAARHAPDRVTEALDEVLARTGVAPEPFARRAAVRVLKRIEW